MEKMKMATAATFGAALTTMFVAPELQADIIDLSFTPSTNAPGGHDHIYLLEISASAGFEQWNDGVGKTIDTLGFGTVTGLRAVSVSDTVTAGQTFVGALGPATGFSASATGTAYVGFRTASGNVGYISMNLGGSGGTITYLTGKYGSMGEAVHVDPVPAPGALALLALGAVGVRRNRKRVA